MNLLKQCQTITLSDKKSREASLELGERYLNHFFLDTTGDIQQYHFPFTNRKAYLYIWNFYSPSEQLNF